MKNSKRLKLKLKKFLASQGMDPAEYLYIKSDAQSYYLLHVESGMQVVVRR